MSSVHDYHEGLPGYSPAQLLKDGCKECERRGMFPWVAIARLDSASFARAWERARSYEGGQLTDVAEAEVQLLRVLWAVQIQLEIRGFPMGEVPTKEIKP